VDTHPKDTHPKDMRHMNMRINGSMLNRMAMPKVMPKSTSKTT
jgi:hypothetical protein